MLKHLKTQDQIAGRNKKEVTLNEVASKTGEMWTVMTPIQLKPALLAAFRRKAKDEHGRDLGEIWSDAALAEYLVNFVQDTYLNIDSIPVGPILGIAANASAPAMGAQVQAQPAQAVQAQAVQAQPSVVQPEIGADGSVPAQAQAVQAAQAQVQTDLPPATIQQ